MNIMQTFREDSWAQADKIGFPKNRGLPFLEEVPIQRSMEEVLSRIFSMYCVGACAYGFNRKNAWSWLEKEGSLHLLTKSETQFLRDSSPPLPHFTEQIEGLWALCWSLKYVPDAEFSKPCPNTFVKIFPDLKKDEPSLQFRKKASFRDNLEILAKCDTAYCLHWGVTHLELTGNMPNSIEPCVIIERRHALEWLYCSDEWDEVPMDT